MSKSEPGNTTTSKRIQWELSFTDFTDYPVVKADGREVKPFLCGTEVRTSPFMLEYFKYHDYKLFRRKVKRGPGKGRARPFPVYGMSYVHLDTDGPSKVQFFSKTKSCSGEQCEQRIISDRRCFRER